LLRSLLRNMLRNNMNKNDNMKKYFQVLGIIIAILIIAFVLLLVWVKVQINQGDLVKWDNKWYTKEELKEAFPPQYIEVEAVNTPEEVYAKVRQALLDDDIETAMENIREEDRDKYKEAFKDEEKLKEWIKTLPDNIEKISMDGNFASYEIDYGTEYLNTASFRKNGLGYWQLSSF